MAKKSKAIAVPTAVANFCEKSVNAKAFEGVNKTDFKKMGLKFPYDSEQVWAWIVKNR